MKRNAFRAQLGAALLALAVLSPGCSDRGKSTETQAPLPVLEPIPAPPGLLASIIIPLPEATWKEARVAVGGPALFLPQSIGGFVTSVLGLPITAADEFDANLPALGVIIDAPERAQPYAALGVHVRVGDRLLDQLTKGEAARFTARVDPSTGIAELLPKGTVKSPVAMGVLGNYLLVGRELADLSAAGPFIARTLAKEPVTAKEDVVLEIPDAALVGPVKRSMDRARSTLQGGAMTMVPLLPLDRITAKLADIVPDLTRARLSIDIDGPAVRLRLSGAPRAGGGPASVALREMAAGDVAPLRALPDGTLLGILDREEAASRSESASTYTDLLFGRAGEAITKEDREAVLAALRSIGEARGPYLAAGVSFGGTGPLGYVRGAVSDEEKLAKALKALLNLSKRSSIKAWLRESGLEIKVGKAVVEDVPGEVTRVTIARVAPDGKDGGKGAKPASGKNAKEKESAGAKPVDAAGKDAKDVKGAKPLPPSDELPTTIDLFYLVRKDGLFATAGYNAKEGFASFLSGAGAPKGSFGDAPEIKAALDALGGDVSFALVVDPLRVVASRAGKPASAPPAPLVVALGRDSGASEGLWLRLDVAVAAIQEIVKHRGAL